jgi:hypothetical protein
LQYPLQHFLLARHGANNSTHDKVGVEAVVEDGLGIDGVGLGATATGLSAIGDGRGAVGIDRGPVGGDRGAVGTDLGAVGDGPVRRVIRYSSYCAIIRSFCPGVNLVLHKRLFE